MVKSAFDHVRHWVFDLDNTLYSPAVRLFDQIEVRMVKFVMDTVGVDESEANDLRLDYWKTYGTTLAGLMREHGVDPDPYLHSVHDIDFTVLSEDPYLASLISQLPGRKIVYTNGSAPYAENVLKARGLSGIFDAVYGVEHADFQPKPERGAFERVFGRDGTDTRTAAMFEDDPRNLAAPHAMGMRTVHVADDAIDAPHIQYHTPDLAAFLARLT
ncbi:pyrimidine 5'-nucleotidase [Marivita sp. S2033]|uniref:pyrimidine 5'-nucleotidase n=1 Tax=Marivita sp. S2033 TaxID=3373187 RepID=UPI0039822E0F